MIDIAYLGPRGTFTEEALWRYYEHYNKPLPDHRQPMSTIEDAIDSVLDDSARYAFVPVENSLGGTVLTTMDYLTEQQDLQICGEIIIPIRHYAWGVAPLAELSAKTITAVYSHPQALRQCSRFLKGLGHAVELREMPSTAEAGRFVHETGWPDFIAIGGEAVGDTYELTRLSDQVQDNMLNLTRFIVISHNKHIMEEPLSDGDKLSLQCELEGLRPGSLYECLGIFAKRHINLLKIESRPTKGRLGEYKFFLDLELKTGQANVREALNELEAMATNIRYFGSYSTIRVD